MKKIISIILVLSMIASLGIAMGASAAYAPEGTAITNAAEFAAMTADGKYYLANDITVDAQYAGEFAGVLDGNGKTITTSVTLFNKIGSATIKNLKLAGSVTIDSTDGGAVLAYTTVAGATVVIDNIINECALNVTQKGDTGALIARINWDEAYGTTVTIKNCTNNAAITGGWRVGGFIGYVSGSDNKEQPCNITIENCVNNGLITSTESYAGGIMSRFSGDGKTTGASTLIIRNCTNNGVVVSATSDVGGILTYLRAYALIEKCLNTANLTAVAGKNMTVGGILSTCDTKNDGTQDGVHVKNCINTGKISTTSKGAGIVGELGGGKKAATAHIVESCINLGEITIENCASDGTTYLAGIVAYMVGATLDPETPNTLKNSLNLGPITGETTAAETKNYVAGIVAYFNSTTICVANNLNGGAVTTACQYKERFTHGFWNNNGSFTPNCSNNYSVVIEGVELLEHNTGCETISTSVVTALDADLAAKLGAAWKMGANSPEPIIEGEVGGTGADFSIFEEKVEETTAAPETSEPAPETTAAPETTEPPVSGETGDSAIIFAAIALIAIAGVAVVAKKKEN